MIPLVAAVHRLVGDLEPRDEREAADRAYVLGWLESTDDVFRRARPATPSPHLVSYVLPVAPDGAYLLLDHRLSGLALPPGGHVEPGEHPHDCAVRELDEEVGVAYAGGPTPSFVTVTETVQRDHVDVSLWFETPLDREAALRLDDREASGARWWSRDDVLAAPAGTLDPEMGRFVAIRHRSGAPDPVAD